MVIRNLKEARKTSYRMSQVRSTNTTPEREMRRLLRSAGLRYRGQRADLPGKPDFTLVDWPIVIEVYGEFWHGRKFASWALPLSLAWREKILANMARDRRVRRQLKKLGFDVVVIWARQLRDPEACLRRIFRAVDGKRKASRARTR